MSITPTGDSSGALAALAVQAGPQVGEEVPIRLPVVSIGRGGQNDIVLADDSVSTTHARLEYADGKWRITDLDSVNGTFVESIKLAPQVPTPLPFGSSVRLGGAKLHFRAVEAADPEAARAAYRPPPPKARVRDRRSGVRVPVWLVVLLLVLLAVAALVAYGWLAVGPPPPPATEQPVPVEQPVPEPPTAQPAPLPPATGAPAADPVDPPAEPGAQPAPGDPGQPTPTAPPDEVSMVRVPGLPAPGAGPPA